MNKPYDNQQVNLIGSEEQTLRLNRLCVEMAYAGIASALICSPANLFYLCGRVFRGYIYILADKLELYYLVRQPTNLQGKNVFNISKPSEINKALSDAEVRPINSDTALELGVLPYSDVIRLCRAIVIDMPSADISPVLRQCRSVKTHCEQELIRLSGSKHTQVYQSIPTLYRKGMTDVDFQIEIERASRHAGCLGQFRTCGYDMEIFMGNVITGDNSDTPSPYDFAMGGAGISPSLPAGANGTLIRPNTPIMVDLNGNYTGYMTDMTRCFVDGKADDMAIKAHNLSIDICNTLAAMMTPGAEAAKLYAKALEMAKDAGFEKYFMGHNSQAGFVGHGVGIEINELPVIAPRSRDILSVGNVIALEPKFVIPGIGAVGVENTYIVSPKDGGECVTNAPQNIISLD